MVTRRELLAAGVTTKAVHVARRGGRLFDVHPDFGVYSVMPPELLTEEGRLIAALATVNGDAFLGLGTAAHRWQLIVAPPVQIELVSWFHHAPASGVRVKRFPALRDTDVTFDGRFPITTVTRTLLDLAISYSLSALLRALAEAEFQHDVRPVDVLAVLRRGHPGSAKLRRAHELHVPGYGQARSRLERRFRRLLVEHGIELPLRNQRLGPYVVDCLWPDLRLVVELDGAQHERDRQSAVDAQRDLWLRRHGYVVRRYSWQQVHHCAADVIMDLLAAFAEARARREP